MLVAVAMALGEQEQVDGKALITAYLAGLELYQGIIRGSPAIAATIHGWHTTPLYGTLGCAGVAGKVLGLTVDQLTAAIAVAASEAGGISRQQGTMVKPFHAGNSARSGVVAASLAKKGFTGDPEIIENPQGFADCFFGPDVCDYPRMAETLGKSFDIVSPGIGLKPYPCSYPSFG